MKKLLTLIFTLALAVTMSAPAFAMKDKGKKSETTSGQEQGETKGKAHKKHSKKKGATEGKKEGQEGTNPSPKQ